jgi:uroporphyrinogen-III synthase
MSRRVLVTRPQPGADATGRKLAALGFDPIVLPLTETGAMKAAALPDLASVDAVAVTSATALRFAPDALLAACRHMPCFVVGRETAAAARKLGFADAEAGPGDALGLARLLAERCGAGARVLYLCGKVRLAAFETELGRAGLVVTAVETYDTKSRGVEAEDLATASGGMPIDAALLYSAESARLLAPLAAAAEGRGVLETTRFFCLSPRIAAALTGIDPSRIAIAGNPDEQSLLDLLGARCGNPP